MLTNIEADSMAGRYDETEVGKEGVNAPVSRAHARMPRDNPESIEDDWAPATKHVPAGGDWRCDFDRFGSVYYII